MLSQSCQLRREESQFSEHTVTSAEDAAMMVGAVVGADVDMGLLKAGGSASFELYQVRATPLRHANPWKEAGLLNLSSGRLGAEGAGEKGLARLCVA